MNQAAASNFRYKVETSRNDTMVLVTGGQDKVGRSAWYYVQIEPTKTLQFRNTLKTGQLTLTDFGKIIYSGFGENPPEEAKRLMKEMYNFEE